MRQLILFSTILFLSLNATAQTQSEMNEQAHAVYKNADKELNSVYQKIIKQYSSDAVFVANLKKAQRLWIQFRDAQMLVKYPHPGEYGSVYPMCYSMELQRLTEERTKELNVWLTGIEEGDLCNGSVKIKN